MFAKVSRAIVLVSLGAVLSACNAGGSKSPLNLGLGNKQEPTTPPVVQGTCPGISLRDGTAFFRTYSSGGKDDPEKVIYQASLADTTRACVKTETGTNITVMVQGRLVAGPMGKAGTLSMPIRVAVVDGDKVLYSELTKFESALTDVAQPAQFVFTKEVVGVQGDLTNLTRIYVGFDEGPSKSK